MFRLPKAMVIFGPLRYCVRHSRRSVSKAPMVKIISTDDDEIMKISFHYGVSSRNQNLLTFKASKHQTLNEVLRRIKLTIDLLKKKEEIRQTIAQKYSGTSEVVEVSYPDEVNVKLVNNTEVIDNQASNIDAWTDGNYLEIGTSVYEVRLNIPTISQLKLPDFIISGCYIRPHLIVESAEVLDSEFTWYRSVGPKTDDLQSDELNWEKVGEGFSYKTSSVDVGNTLKVVCVPKLGKREGISSTAVSPGVVEQGPPSFPFEERHLYTKDVVDSDCIRCISYNVLASIYVETRRFPYCSKKAKDSYYRKQLLVRELLGYNSDVICLQEVQERLFALDILPIMNKAGYDGYFVKKGGRKYEGLAILYRTKKFKLIERQGVYLNQIVKEKEIFSDLLTRVSGNFKDMSKLLAQDTALQLALLEHVEKPSHRLLVANTHLYSNKDTPEVRLLQAALCTCFAEHRFNSLKNNENLGLVFCGDFNSLPNSAAYEYVTKGLYECCSSWKNSAIAKDVDTSIRHGLSLDSACGTPVYTNYTEEFQGCLDYIFYDKKSLDVIDVVPMPSHKDVTEQIALPSEFFPSDHIALICTLKWKEFNGQ